MHTKKIQERKMILLLFFLCWIIYFVSYLGKRNFPAAMTEMIASGFLQKSQAGFINTLFFLCYGAGQLLNGILADRLSPSKLILGGLLLSGAANLGMGLSAVYWLMPVLWAVNGYALSMLWAPILRLFSDLLEGDSKVTCTVNLSTAVAAGSLGSYLLSALMISVSGWRAAFYAAALFLFLSAAVWFVLYERIQRHLQLRGVELPEETPCPSPSSQKDFMPARLVICCAGVLLLCVPVLIHGMLRDGVSSWVPTYINESFSVTPALSVLLATLLPFVNLAGPYIAHFMNRRYFKNEVTTSAFFFIVSTGCLVCLASFGKNSLTGCIFFLCVITTAIEAINVMVVSLIPLRYGAVGKAATMSGFFNFITYVGSAISAFGIGVVAEHAGWLAVIWIWGGCSAIGLAVCLLARKRKLAGVPIVPHTDMADSSFSS